MNQMSVDGIRISHVASKGRELSQYMANILDEDWKRTRGGMEIQSVGISSITYDDESKELINMRNKGAMLGGDPSVREGYVQGSIARGGLEAAGSNEGGSTGAFLGMGIGMQGAGGFMEAASATNRNQMAQQAKYSKRDEATKTNDWYCSECGAKTMGNSVQNVAQKTSILGMLKLWI